LKEKSDIGKDLFSFLWEFVFSYSFLNAKKHLREKNLKILKFDVWEESSIERYKTRKITPFLESMFEPKSITYIDIDSHLVRKAKILFSKKSRIFIKGNICSMPFKNESFDIVVDFSTTDHLSEKEFLKSLKETSRVLKSGGLYLIYHLNKEYFNIEEWNKIYSEDLIPSYARNLSDIAKKLKKLNFEILNSFYFFPFLYDVTLRWFYFLNRHRTIFALLPRKVKFRFFDNPKLNLFFFLLAQKI